jgi:hypothetical protein
MSALPQGKDLKVLANRGSQIGDALASLCVTAYMRWHFPNCYVYWQLARKHVHALPLLYNHPLIDNLFVSDCEEGYGPRDIEIARSAHIHLPLMPEHPEPHIPWPTVRSFYQETFVMSGLTMDHWNSVPDSAAALRPRLTQWFTIERRPKTIAYWPCAAYGQTQIRRSRNASRPWAQSLVARLVSEGYTVLQCGHPRDYADCGGPLEGATDVRHLSFMDLIKVSLGCDAIIGTDSGAGIAFGAYGHPQVTLLTDHFPGHTTNLTAFEPWNPNNRSLVGVGSADAISLDSVVEALHSIR